MKISYKDLAQRISEMPLDRQEDDVSVFFSGVGEVYMASDFGPSLKVDQKCDLDGVLEQGHYIIKI